MQVFGRKRFIMDILRTESSRWCLAGTCVVTLWANNFNRAYTLRRKAYRGNAGRGICLVHRILKSLFAPYWSPMDALQIQQRTRRQRNSCRNSCWNPIAIQWKSNGSRTQSLQRRRRQKNSCGVSNLKSPKKTFESPRQSNPTEDMPAEEFL